MLMSEVHRGANLQEKLQPTSDGQLLVPNAIPDGQVGGAPGDVQVNQSKRDDRADHVTQNAIELVQSPAVRDDRRYQQNTYHRE